MPRLETLELPGDGTPDIDPILDGPVATANAAIAARPGPVVVVSDEVGLGIVPMNANARVYRDLVGIAHVGKLDEAHSVVEGVGQVFRQLLCDPGFSYAARTRQRHEAHVRAANEFQKRIDLRGV